MPAEPGGEIADPLSDCCSHRSRDRSDKGSDHSGERERNPSTAAGSDARALQHVLPIRALAARQRNKPIEPGDDERLDVDHRETSFSERRSAVCALLNVAETVPSSTPSTVAIAR